MGEFVDSTLDDLKTPLTILSKLMLPKTSDANALFPEQPCHFSVPLTITLNLCGPKLLMRLRDMTTSFTTMPKTPIDENGQLDGFKEEIGLSWQIRALFAPPRHSCPH